MSNRPLKTVHREVDPGLFKMLYIDWDTRALRPDVVFVRDDGSIVFEINEVGFKGDRIDDARKLAVVWGDSVVFGAGYSWPHLMDAWAPGYQFMNGGIEGDPHANILRRATEFNRRHQVALNVLMLGWHLHPMFGFDPQWHRVPTIPFGRSLVRARSVVIPNLGLRRRLTAFLREFPNTVVATLPFALHAGLVEQDLSPSFVHGDDDTGFIFMGHQPYSVDIQRAVWEYVNDRNRIAREVCADLGVRVIDLFEKLNTRPPADYRDVFRDFIHFRVRAYPRVARTVYEGLADLL